jgi:hypothetical protein
LASTPITSRHRPCPEAGLRCDHGSRRRDQALNTCFERPDQAITRLRPCTVLLGVLPFLGTERE